MGFSLRANAPCKDCPNRVVDVTTGYRCHNDCAAYLAYRAGQYDIYEARKTAMDVGGYQIASYKKKKHEKYRKQKGQGR